MSTQTVSSAARSAFSPEVIAFAREQGVEQYLPELLELVRQVYPSASRFDILVEDDPEIANDRHIVFAVEVSIELEQAREADYRWHTGVFRIVPAPLVCVFRHRADLRP
jgi:DNA-binding FadR family transcriptional regulator